MTDLPSLGPRGEGWVVVQVVLLVLVAVSGFVAGGVWTGTLAALTGLLGLVLMVAGALLLGRGLLDLGRSLTPLPYPRDDAQLVDRGIYALARHPIYGGLMVTATGWGLIAASLAGVILAAGLAAFFALKSRREEQWLRERFPGYPAYASRTKRFIPWLY